MADSDYQQFHGIRALSPIDALGIAASGSKQDAIDLLLSDGVDIDGIASYSKSTALCSAASNGSPKTVAFLLDRGAGVDARGANDMTPLMNACSRGKKTGFLIASQLLDAGANSNAVRESDEMTPLKFSISGVNADLVRLLIEHGASVDGPDDTSQTALMLAARNNFVEGLRVLVEAGASRTRQCGLPWAENRTAQGLAELEKRRSAVAFLKSLD